MDSFEQTAGFSAIGRTNARIPAVKAGDGRTPGGTVQPMRDPLTGVYHRRFAEETLSDAIAHSRERARPLSVILADIDHFRSLNEQFGATVGDLVLQHVARIMNYLVRDTEGWVARLAEDEFLICLPGADLALSRRTANRIRLAIFGERLQLRRDAIRLSCSFGICTLDRIDQETSADLLIRNAREILNEAKNAGGNLVKA